MNKFPSKILWYFLSTLFIASCSNDQYTVEKHYFSAQRQAEKIFKNPLATPPNELEKTVTTFSNFVTQHPQTALAVEAEFIIAKLYMVKEEYEKTRLQLKKIISDYAKFPDICSEAAFLIGSSYEIDRKWDLALEQYKKLMQKYPATRKSLQVPIYIARYYKTKFQPDKMIAAYQEAITHYKMLTEKYPNSVLAYTAYTLMARCQMATKNWQAAVNVFTTMREEYKNSKIMKDGILLNIALIYAKEIKNNAKAKEALETLIKEYPHSRLIKAANKFLEEINKK